MARESIQGDERPPKQKRDPIEKQSTSDRHRISVTIGKEPDEVFAFWRNFSNLPKFMKDVKSIEMLSPTRSRWVIELQSGMKTEWEAEIVSEEPGRLISWKSVADSPVTTEGTVWFLKAPADRGTIVTLSLDYSVPGGKLTEIAGKLTGEDPYNLILTNLRRLKALLETGEYPTVEGQPSGRDEDAEEILKH